MLRLFSWIDDTSPMLLASVFYLLRCCTSYLEVCCTAHVRSRSWPELVCKAFWLCHPEIPLFTLHNIVCSCNFIAQYSKTDKVNTLYSHPLMLSWISGERTVLIPEIFTSFPSSCAESVVTTFPLRSRCHNTHTQIRFQRTLHIGSCMWYDRRLLRQCEWKRTTANLLFLSIYTQLTITRLPCLLAAQCTPAKTIAWHI